MPAPRPRDVSPDAAATLLFSLILLKPGSWDDIRSMSSENLPWFLSSAVLVAISQAFVYALSAVHLLMVVTPILQLSELSGLFLSQWINRDYEVMTTAVLVGALTTGAGFNSRNRPTRRAGQAVAPPAIAQRFRAPPAGGRMISSRVVSCRARCCS